MNAHLSAKAADERWAQSLAEGPAGAALLQLELGQDGREPLTAMLGHPVWTHPDDATLFEGAPAVAFTLAATTQRDALAELDGHVDRIVRSRLTAAHRRIDDGGLPAKEEFDLISGLTGHGAYLLRRSGNSELLRDVLRYLVRLTEPRPDGRPGWWAAGAPTSPGPEWENGHGNFGIAHGITGPLCLLAQAVRRRITVEGQAGAITRICSWLERWRCGTTDRTWWPEMITYAEHDAGVARRRHPHRPSWCYGTPGISRAVQLAGLALADSDRQHEAERILSSCLADDAQLALLSDVSICHGWAGLLHTAWRVGEHNEQVRAYVPRLLDQLDECCRHTPAAAHGLLVGDTGVRLARRAAATNTQPVTRWDACLLLDA